MADKINDLSEIEIPYEEDLDGNYSEDEEESNKTTSRLMKF